MAERFTLAEFDACECGDYRRDHDGLHGAGRCRLANDLTHGFEPCTSFRLFEPATEIPEVYRKMDASLEMFDKVFSHPGLHGLRNSPGRNRP